MIDAATLLPWSEPTTAPTGQGPKMVRKAKPNDAFWALWASHKEELKALGVQPSRFNNGSWEIFWWLNQDGTPSPKVAAPKPGKVVPAKLDPEIAEKLRDYQRQPAAQIVGGFDVHSFILDSSDMGAGKSYVAMAACRQRGLQPVIICRKAAFSAWKKVAAYFGYPDPVISNYEKVRTGNSPLGTWVRKSFGESKRKIEVFEWTLPGGSFLVLDEVHWCTGNRTQNSNLLMSAAYQRISTLGLSATAADSPLKMRAMGYALGLHKGRNFDEWCYDHGCEKGQWALEFTCGISRGSLYAYDGKDEEGKPKFAVRPEKQAALDARRREVMGRIHQQIFSTGRGVRIRIDDVPGFPEVEIVPHLMNFDTVKDIARAYADLRDELSMLKKQSDRMAVMRTAHQKIELLKVELVADEVNDLADQGYSVPVFTNFTASLEKLADLCKTDLLIYGGQKDSERVRVLDDFQSNRKHKIILNNQAGGESIGLHDLLGERQRISYVFPTWWAVAFRQVMGRTRRDGAKSKSLIRVAFAGDTVEEEAYESVKAKCARIDAFNDSDLQPQSIFA